MPLSWGHAAPPSLLGEIEAPDAKAAEGAAAAQFGLDEEQRKRLAVRKVE